MIEKFFNQMPTEEDYNKTVENAILIEVMRQRKGCQLQ